MNELAGTEQTKDARILILEDYEPNLRLLELLLSQAGYVNLRAKRDPREALELLDDFQPQLVLLDLQLPHMSGLTVMEEISRRLPEQARPPILVLTGDISSKTRESAISRGATDFVYKPFDVEEVLQRVEKLLQAS